jgi:hypothetical protein
MIRRQRHHERLAAYDLTRYGWLRDWRPYEGHVQAVFSKRVELLRHSHRLKFNPDLLMTSAKEAYRLADVLVVHAVADRNAQTPDFAAPRTPSDECRAIGARENLSRLVEELLACVRQLDASLRAPEQGRL